MRTCPSCGAANADDANTCALCGRALVPGERPEEPAFAAAPPPETEQPTPVPPPPLTPQPIPPPPTPTRPAIVPHPQLSLVQWRNRFLLGIGLGMIPVVIALISIGVLSSPASTTLGTLGIVGPIAAFVLYLATFIGMIVCLAINRLRPTGYGLLTMVFAGPVITAASCSVIPSLVRG